MDKPYKRKIIWPNVIFHTLYHCIGLQGIYYILSSQVQPKTLTWAFLLERITDLGITAGVHRLWSHKSYRANLPLRIFLATLQTISYQDTIFVWARNHRVHHKFSDSDADPHNVKGGIFFSHIGWLLVRKHPEVIRKGKTVDVSDLEADPVVRFQRKYYVILVVLGAFVIPTVVPWYFWNENLYISFTTAGVLRLLVNLHVALSVNSIAHRFGCRPYDKNIEPAENSMVSYITSGEGWHNYHHCFPWDYKAAELGGYAGNLTKAFIDVMAKAGWAYDLKTAHSNLVKAKMSNTGDEIAKNILS